MFKIVEEYTEFTRYPIPILFAGNWENPIQEARIRIELDIETAQKWFNNVNSVEFQALVECINKEKMTEKEWEIMVGKDIPYMDSSSPRRLRNSDISQK